MKYYVGIDLGGTNIVAGVVDENYKIVGKGKLKTNIGRSYEEILTDIIETVKLAISDAGLEIDDIRWIGIGCPGTCNTDTGVVEYSNNSPDNNDSLKTYTSHSQSYF